MTKFLLIFSLSLFASIAIAYSGGYQDHQSTLPQQKESVVLESEERNILKRIDKLEKLYRSVLSQQTTKSSDAKQPAFGSPSPKNLNTLTLPPFSNGILRTNGVGSLSASLIDLTKDTTGTLPISLGGTGGTSFTQYGLLYGNGTAGFNTIAPGTSGYILATNGTGTMPSWIPYPSQSSSFASLAVGNNSPFTIDAAGRTTLSYQGNSGYLSSSGGAFFFDNTNNLGTGLGIYSNAGSDALGNMINVKVDNPNYGQAAFYMNYDGSSNAVEIVNNSSDSSSNTLAVTGNNIYDSTLGIIGNELAKGTIKVTHYRPEGGTDSNAAGIAIDLKGAGTRAQGLYVDSTESGGTLGNLLRLRNTSIDKFVVDYQGNVSVAGNIVHGAYGTDTSWTKYGNTTGDQFFVGTNGSFRVQRAASNSEAFRVQINGDTQGRWRGTSDGSLQWGDGTNTQDVILRRGASGMLWLTGGMIFNNANNAFNTIVKGATDNNLLYVNAASNSIGIGLSAPLAPLHIDKNSLGNAAFIINQQGNGPLLAASASGTAVFTVDKSGNIRSVSSLCVKATISSSCAGSTPGTIYANNTTVQAADLAENYISSQQLEPGDIVMPAQDGNNQAIVKTTQQYQSQAIGIISTNPGVTLNSDAQTDAAHPHIYPVALQGRVLLKVTTANGHITSGDLLSPSSVPGVAMKATKKGTTIAKALESYNAPNTQEIGKIMAFVTVSYHDFDNIPAVAQTTPQQTTLGSAIIPAGAKEVTVKTASATAIARLFVEPEETPVATAISKKSDDTFVIKIAAPQEQDLTLHWWLLN